MSQKSPPCWICGQPASTLEHRLKRSDAKATFGEISQKKPLFFHTDEERNQRVQTVRSPLLSFQSPLCDDCNNKRTQPHDKAWEKLSAALRKERPNFRNGGQFDTREVFGDAAAEEMLNVHLFFVKQFLGMISDGDRSFPSQSFRDAILSNSPHPNLYLKFGYYGSSDGVVASSTNLQASFAPSGDPACAAYIYEPGGGIGVLVMYAADGVFFDGLFGAWTPRLNSTRLRIENFSLDEDADQGGE